MQTIEANLHLPDRLFVEKIPQDVENLKKTTFAGPIFNMFNRKQPPAVHRIGKLPLPHMEEGQTSNGIKLHTLPFPGREIVKIELVFQAGRPQEIKRLVSRSTARLIREGSKNRTASEIAETLDYYGSSFLNPTSLDTANFVLYTIRKYAAEVIPLFAEAIIQPAFPEDELHNFAENSIRELKIETQKSEVKAYRQLTENMYGTVHPYGYNSSESDYRAVTREDLTEHHSRLYCGSNAHLFVSGEIDDALLRDIENALSGLPKGSPIQPFSWPESLPGPSQRRLIEGKASQAAIKIGRRMFNRHHPDYYGMYLLNTILGGYFGSRLMANIRENKGYTYNIYSTLDTLRYDGYFYIATDVNKENTNAAVKQIYREMSKLREKPVGSRELDMVRNYLMGMLLNGLDGPTNTSDLVKSIISDDLPIGQIRTLAEQIQSISAIQLQELANKYLRQEDMWTVIAE